MFVTSSSLRCCLLSQQKGLRIWVSSQMALKLNKNMQGENPLLSQFIFFSFPLSIQKLLLLMWVLYELCRCCESIFCSVWRALRRGDVTVTHSGLCAAPCRFCSCSRFWDRTGLNGRRPYMVCVELKCAPTPQGSSCLLEGPMLLMLYAYPPNSLCSVGGHEKQKEATVVGRLHFSSDLQLLPVVGVMFQQCHLACRDTSMFL